MFFKNVLDELIKGRLRASDMWPKAKILLRGFHVICLTIGVLDLILH
jgi:hypothetical protein